MIKQNIKTTGLLIVSLICMVAAVMTAIPNTQTSEMSILGYKAICPFSPISTVITAYMGLMLYQIWKKKTEDK